MKFEVMDLLDLIEPNALVATQRRMSRGLTGDHGGGAEGGRAVKGITRKKDKPKRSICMNQWLRLGNIRSPTSEMGELI